MKIVYYSPIDYADCDFNLIREYVALGQDVYYFVPLMCNKLSCTLININRQIHQSDILPISEYQEFSKYSAYFPKDKSFVVNRLKKGAHPQNIILYVKLLFKIIRLKPDVVHVSSPFSGPELILYLLRSKIVLTIHDPLLHSGESNGRIRLQRYVAFRFLKRFVLLNKCQKEVFIETNHIKGNVHISRLGAYDNLCDLIPKGNRERPYVLFFGRISPYKGVDRLCEAMQIVHSHIPNLKCVIAGKGKINFEQNLIEGKEYIDFQNRYISPEEMVGLIKGASFVVLPYKDATQSGVICSCFALGTPVIVSNVGALSEAVSDGKTGLLLDPEEDGYVERLALAIEKLYSDDELLKKMRLNIREESLTGRYSWNVIAKENLEFYRPRDN